MISKHVTPFKFQRFVGQNKPALKNPEGSIQIERGLDHFIFVLGTRRMKITKYHARQLANWILENEVDMAGKK